MMAASEPQTPLELASLLRRKVDGEPFPHSFIHEADPYSAPPEVLVRGREHAPGTDQGDGKGVAWYFCSRAKYKESGIGGSARRRSRQIGGGAAAGNTCWRSEQGKQQILGPDRKSTGAYRGTLTYVLKIENPPGARKRYRYKSLGWIMLEIGLEHQQAGPRLVLCKVYRSPNRNSETSTVGRTAGIEDVGPAAGTGISGVQVRQHDSAVQEARPILDESLHIPDGDTPAPRPALCDYNLHSPAVIRNPALSIGPASMHGTLAIVKKGNAASAAATVVMNFGGSSIPSAERMKEMAKLVLSSENPVVVLSAMGNTTTNIFQATWKALTCSVLRKASEIREVIITEQLHRRTVDELGLDSSTVSGSLYELESHLQYVVMTKELTPRTRDYLVFFGQRTSTKIFLEYLNKLEKGKLQEWELKNVTTFGRVGSDLAAAIIGRDLGSSEIQVWKNQDSIFTCDPNVSAKAIPLPCLTFDEAAEIGFFAAKSIQIAMEGGQIVIVKNSYNPQARGTVITKTRDTSKSTITSIVLESNITILDIERTSKLNQEAFVVKAISIFKYFEDLGIYVDWVAAREGKMSFTLVPSKLLSQESIQPALDNAVEELKKFATVDRRQNRSVISLVGIPQMSTVILERALNVLRSMYVDVEKISQGSFKVTKVSLMVHGSKAKDCVQSLHSAFFEDGFVSEVQGSENECEIPVNSSVAAVASSSGANKRKAGDDHPEAPPGVRQLQTLSTDSDGRPEEAEPQVSSDPVPVGGNNFWEWEDDYFNNNFGQSDHLWSPLPYVDHDAVQNAIEEGRRRAGSPHQWYPGYYSYCSYSGTKQMDRRHQQRRWYNLWSPTNYSPHNVLKFLTPLVVLWLAACLARFLAKRSSVE